MAIGFNVEYFYEAIVMILVMKVTILNQLLFGFGTELANVKFQFAIIGKIGSLFIILPTGVCNEKVF